ncbi:hypothetical protein D9M68_184520 [compost metagenome]
MAFGREARHSAVLQLGAIDRIGEIHGLVRLDRPALLLVARRARQTEEHRSRIGGALRRASASVLQVTALAGAGVVERAEPVGGLGRGGRGDPELAKQRVAELEAFLFLEAEIGRKLREAVGIDGRDRGRSAAGHGLEGFGLGKIHSRSRHRCDAIAVGVAQVGTFGRKIVARGGGQGEKERLRKKKREKARCAKFHR